MSSIDDMRTAAEATGVGRLMDDDDDLIVYDNHQPTSRPVGAAAAAATTHSTPAPSANASAQQQHQPRPSAPQEVPSDHPRTTTYPASSGGAAYQQQQPQLRASAAPFTPGGGGSPQQQQGTPASDYGSYSQSGASPYAAGAPPPQRQPHYYPPHGQPYAQHPPSPYAPSPYAAPPPQHNHTMRGAGGYRAAVPPPPGVGIPPYSPSAAYTRGGRGSTYSPPPPGDIAVHDGGSNWAVPPSYHAGSADHHQHHHPTGAPGHHHQHHQGRGQQRGGPHGAGRGGGQRGSGSGGGGGGQNNRQSHGPPSSRQGPVDNLIPVDLPATMLPPQSSDPTPPNVSPTVAEYLTEKIRWVAVNGEVGGSRPLIVPEPLVPDEGFPQAGEHVHSSLHTPSRFPHVNLHVVYYNCPLCAPHTVVTEGKINTRPPDLKLGGICGDVSAWSIAHLLSVITQVKVIAIDMFGRSFGRCNLWLEDPEVAPALIQRIDRRMWMAPLTHGYAVVCNDDPSREYLFAYLENMRKTGPRRVFFPRHLVTADRWTP